MIYEDMLITDTTEPETSSFGQTTRASFPLPALARAQCDVWSNWLPQAAVTDCPNGCQWLCWKWSPSPLELDSWIFVLAPHSWHTCSGPCIHYFSRKSWEHPLEPLASERHPRRILQLGIPFTNLPICLFVSFGSAQMWHLIQAPSIQLVSDAASKEFHRCSGFACPNCCLLLHWCQWEKTGGLLKGVHVIVGLMSELLSDGACSCSLAMYPYFSCFYPGAASQSPSWASRFAKSSSSSRQLTSPFSSPAFYFRGIIL